MKYILYSLIVIYVTSNQALSQTINWTGFPAGGTSYTSGIMTATITSTSPGFQNGTPRHYAGSTVGNGQCGIAGGLALEHMFGNITNAHSTLTMDFTSGNTTKGLCGNISFRIKDINSDESNQTFADWVEISAIDGNNNPVPVANIVASGGSNKINTTSGNTRIIKGHSNNSYRSRSTTNCDDVTFTITPVAGTTLKSVILKYHPDYTPSPNDYYNFTGPTRPAYQYISISSITITPSTGPTNVALTATPASCSEDNGTVTIGAVTGGTSPYQFDFNNQGLSGTTFFDNLASGNYNITVIDNNGCSHNASVNVPNQPGPTAIAVTSTPTSCGVANGQVTLGNVTGGTSPYQYNFNNQGFSSTTTYTDLTDGNYSLIVRDANGCTYSTSVTVTIGGPITPTFTNPGPICTGTSFTLPTTSTNGITGTWAPAINNNATTTYTFTPTSGCATTTTMQVVISNQVTPTFTNPGPICAGTSFTLPTTSTNGITGTWAPAINNNATTTYTFTPTSGCATTTTMQVVVSNQVTPAFTNPGPICTGTSFTLPTTSTNGITGAWTPAINNNATTTYTFTPTSGCATTTTMQVVVSNQVTPTFTNPGPICTGTSFTLPTTSTNGITGTWAPAINNNATTTYTFTPTSGCATTTTMQVVISNQVTPTFTNPGPICAGTSFTLPTTSINGITGTWTPAINNNATTTYTFTPSSGCATTTTMQVVVNDPITGVLTNSTPASCGKINGEITLGAVTGGTSPYDYNFNNQGFSSTTTYSYLNGENYTIVVRDDNGCTYTTSVAVNSVGSAPTDIDYLLIPGTCEENGSFIVTDVYGGNAPYSFSHNGTVIGDTIVDVSAGGYNLLITDTDGCALDTVLFMPDGIGEETIHIPNVFTPNEDLANDTWFISGTCIISLECVIVNRWGEVMAKLDNITDEWDGKINGHKASEGVYFYKAKITYYSGNAEEFHGHITLID
jgi:gliding motility-associated-like protein